jgi:hypothetical protein
VQFQPKWNVGGQNAFEIKHDKRNASGYDHRPKGYNHPVFPFHSAPPSFLLP